MLGHPGYFAWDASQRKCTRSTQQRLCACFAMAPLPCCSLPASKFNQQVQAAAPLPPPARLVQQPNLACRLGLHGAELCITVQDSSNDWRRDAQTSGRNSQHKQPAAAEEGGASAVGEERRAALVRNGASDAVHDMQHEKRMASISFVSWNESAVDKGAASTFPC